MRLLDPVNRAPRADHVLDGSAGLYALFMVEERSLPDFSDSEGSLIYIGKAAGAGGLRTRCHFRGGTRNHSPRKSLAVILMDSLGLRPTPIHNADESYKTWALETASEQKLDLWMHRNLLLSICPSPDAVALEKALIRDNAPLLNLTDCLQTERHRRITAMRRDINAQMRLRLIDGLSPAAF